MTLVKECKEDVVTNFQIPDWTKYEVASSICLFFIGLLLARSVTTIAYLYKIIPYTRQEREKTKHLYTFSKSALPHAIYVTFIQEHTRLFTQFCKKDPSRCSPKSRWRWRYKSSSYLKRIIGASDCLNYQLFRRLTANYNLQRASPYSDRSPS